ncbi:hypothetical protein E1B28_003647 [Marasmius oreades]|uniref:Uncharacterized protein n=1 Tax=Marasmius oreades TaxID=181124 RepID=A0A9P7UX00_9AGAR|nr:uncharacterized protein E1B28_003647 [Marasmius oreades]KAG7096197.1 hypothetical protein E1B28_003647 [Marasmius oreades]
MAPTPLLRDSKSGETHVFLVWVVSSFIITAFHFILYGLYIPLFRTSLILMRKRPPSRAQTFHKIALIVLFTLASAAVPLGLAFDIHRAALAFYSDPNPYYRTQIDIQIARYVIIYIMMLFIDSILIFRCFVIFGYRKKKYALAVVIGLVFIFNMLGTVFSIWTEIEFRRRPAFSHFVNIPQYLANGFLGILALINFVLTTLLATRIWWLLRKNREIQSMRGNEPSSSYMKGLSTVVAILLESGIIYLVMYVVFIVGNLAKDSFDLGSMMIQIGGITPTLIFVRVNMNGRPSEFEEADEDGSHRLQTQSTFTSRSVRSLSEIQTGYAL